VSKNLINYIDWWETTQEEGLEKVKTFFSEIDIPGLYFPIISKFVKNKQLKNYQVDFWDFTTEILGKYSSLSIDNQEKIITKNLDLLFRTLENLESVEERINLLESFQASEKTKAKIFTIPILNDLLNYAYSNLLNLFISFQEVIEGSQQNSVSLKQKINYLAGEKRSIEYKEIVDMFNPNLRNAMSHGKVRYEDSKVQFTFIEKANSQEFENTEELSYYQLKSNLLNFFDELTAVFLAWIKYLCELNLDFDKLTQVGLKEDTLKEVQKLNLSTLDIDCTSFETINILGDETKRHLNLELIHPNLDINSRVYFGLHTALRSFQLIQTDNLQSVHITFTSSRSINSFIRVSREIIKDLLSNTIEFEGAISKIISNQEIMMFEVNDEVRNESKDLFQGYSDIVTENYRVSEINDSSLTNKKKIYCSTLS
jgi:hypothetical protein